MKKYIFLLPAALLATAAFAADDVYEAREDTMKGFGAALKELTAVAKGEAEFDAAAVEAKLQEVHENSMKVADLFPEGSNEGDSEALDAIWNDAEGFQAVIDDFIMRTMVDPAPTDANELGIRLAQIGGGCKACHSDYRKEQEES